MNPQDIQDVSSQALRLEWLTIYGDIFQKFIFTAVSAFLLAQSQNFRDLFSQTVKSSARVQIIFGSSFVLLGILGAGFGYLRYQETDWAFLDIQIIFTVLMGIALGVRGGLIGGVCAGLFRLLIGVGRVQYWIILLAAGSLSGFLFQYTRKRKWPKRILVLLTAILSSLIHGMVTYLPRAKSLGGSAALEIIFSLVLIESLCIYIFMTIVFGVTNREDQKQLEKLLPQMKLKFLQAQINPHFLFNTLNTIAAVCSRERAEQARDLVLKLSNYFRRIIKREDEWVTLEEELDYVNTYLDIEKVRFQNALQINYQLQLSKRGMKALIPVLIIQPIVENAIKHGISEKAGGGTLEICARENEKTVEIIIRDTGVGFKPSVLKKLQADGELPSEDDEKGGRIGLRNINERLRYQFGPESLLQIKSEVGVGSTVRFQIPIKHEKGE